MARFIGHFRAAVAALLIFGSLSAAAQRSITILNTCNSDTFSLVGITLSYNIPIDKEFRGLLRASCPTEYHDISPRLLSHLSSR